MVNQSHVMSQSPSYSVNIVRNVTRLKSMFASCYADSKTSESASELGVNIKDAIAGERFIDTVQQILNHPMGLIADASNYSSARDVEWQISIGSQCFPVYPCRSSAESFFRFKQAVGIVRSSLRSLNITYMRYLAMKPAIYSV